MRNPTQQEIHDILAEIYKQPDIESVRNEMRKVANGAKTMPKMNQRYFFKERTMSTVNTGVPFGVILDGDEAFMKVFEFANRYCRKYYEDTGHGEEDYIHQCALMMKAYARLFRKYHLPSTFDFGRAKEIMEKYNVNGLVYDFACGWGQRMVAALSLGIDYYGTDTNPELCKCLEDCAKEFILTNNLANHATILNQRSEVEIPGLKNAVGLCFSSPPYFNYELYRGAETSTTLYPEYDAWRDNYLKGTFTNCFNYLVPNGYLAVNVKNIDSKCPIYEDTFKALTDLGMDFVGEEPYKVGNIRHGAKNQKNKVKGYADERIMVFKKTLQTNGQVV